MEEKKLTSKEILPEEVRNDFRRVQKAEADLFPSSYLVKYAFFTLLSTIEAAEREVEEKDKRFNDLIKSTIIDVNVYENLIKRKNAEIEELKREIERLKTLK